MSHTALRQRPVVGEPERLGATLVLSLLVHALFILGIGFALEDSAPVMRTLDAILTQTQSPLTPQQADFLAQASNQGGGEHERSSRPLDSQAGRIPQAESGIAPMPLRAQSPAAAPAVQARVISNSRSIDQVPEPQPRAQVNASTLPPGAHKIERDIAMARLAAEIHLRSQRYAKRPKRKFVSASTREYVYAAYLRNWVDRVERVGNLNYPDEARRRRIGGVLVISVAIRRDGSVERADIIQSSTIPMLDAAALRIVQLSTPFAPLPDTEENVDVLHVTRTWQFLPDGGLVDQ